MQNKELLHELFQTKRQKTKIIFFWANNLSTDIKFNKLKMSKIIQSGGFAIPLDKNVLAPWATIALASENDGAI